MRYCNFNCPKLSDCAKQVDLGKLHLWLISKGFEYRYLREGKVCEYTLEDFVLMFAIYEYSDKDQKNEECIAKICDKFGYCIETFVAEINSISVNINEQNTGEYNRILDALDKDQSIYAQAVRIFLGNEDIYEMELTRVSGTIEIYKTRENIYEQLIAKKGSYFFDTSIKKILLKGAHYWYSLKSDSETIKPSC